MIEDKEIGIKITESEEETLWINQKKAIENEISNLEKLIKINKAYLEKTNEILENLKKPKDL
jgi:hypothetical protein